MTAEEGKKMFGKVDAPDKNLIVEGNSTVEYSIVKIFKITHLYAVPQLQADGG